MWQTPKTNWTMGNTILSDAFNRIESNEAHLNSVLTAHLDTTTLHIIQCTSTSRPASPANGQYIYETDTKKLMFYNNAWIDVTSWANIHDTPTTVDGYGITDVVKVTPSPTAGTFDRTTIAPTATDRLNYNGYFYATRVYNAVYKNNDYAEFFERAEDTEPGDVISYINGRYGKSKAAYDPCVVGVHSDTYGYCVGGDEASGMIPVGLAGRVQVKVTGDVQPGKLLVASDIPGVAMQADRYVPETIIGKALDHHAGSSIDRIRMLIQ